VYVDRQAAIAEGHCEVPIPPTLLFGIELEQPEPFAWLGDLGVDLRHVLHGSQQFEYHACAHIGEVLTARPRITDVYAKRSGALEFIVKQTDVTRADGTDIATLTTTIVVQHPEIASERPSAEPAPGAAS
jgi:hypothetical protein